MDVNVSRLPLLFVLLGLFTVLFVLQVWAMLRIKKMLKTVLKIYAQVTRVAGNVSASTGAVNLPRRICQNCKFRQTYLRENGQPLFFYRCGLNGQVIQLNDFCQRFEVDPLRAET